MQTTRDLCRLSRRLQRKADRILPSDERATAKSDDPLDGYDPHFDLRGGNEIGYYSRDDELLLAGPAGTGKSLTNLLHCYRVARDFPGARILIVRKTRESLTESVLVTWERDILGPTHPILTRRPVIRRVRQSYTFPNRSEVVVGGIDKPGKILSSEYDLIYVPESTDLDLEDWETLGGRLRAARVPYQQMIADCNPTTPHHWLYKRFQAGSLTLIPTTHKDNPRYWDATKEEWTSLGQQYLARLSRMTGNRRERFLLGKWVAAEGVVYSFDPEVHQLPKGWEPPRGWPRVWGVDWGESSPTALGMFAVDPQGRMYHYREVYQTHLRADKLGEWAKAEVDSGREPVPHGIVCDHDPDKKVDFERTSKLTLTMAEKADRLEGIQAMQERFDVQEDGKPRMFLRPDALAHEPDRILVEKGEPTGSVSEIVAYVWDEDFLADEPIEGRDHWCFAAGTMIEMASGRTAIEKVRPGDLVWTRAGLRRVLDAGMTSPSEQIWRVPLSSGSELLGTAEHPVFVKGKGFARLDALRYNDTLLSVAENPLWKSSNYHRKTRELSASGSTGLFIGDTRTARMPGTATTFDAERVTPRKDSGGFIGTYGSTTTERSRRATRFITRTILDRSTTGLETSNAFPVLLTKRSTLSHLDNEVRRLGGKLLPTSKRNGFAVLPSGIVHQRGGRGIRNKELELGSTESLLLSNASGAGTIIERAPLTLQTSIARQTAELEPGGIVEWTMRIGCASGAGRSSRSTSISQSETAQGNALAVLPQPDRAKGAARCSDALRASQESIAVSGVPTMIEGRIDPVFNLTVEGDPEYYANGVLVHNCDQARYCVRYCNANFPGPHSSALLNSYSTAKPVAAGIDRITRLPKGIFK